MINSLLIIFLNHYLSNCFLAHSYRVFKLSATATLLHLGRYIFSSSFNSSSNTSLFGPSRWISSTWGKGIPSFRLIRWTIRGFYIIELKWLCEFSIVITDNSAYIVLLVICNQYWNSLQSFYFESWLQQWCDYMDIPWIVQIPWTIIHNISIFLVSSWQYIHTKSICCWLGRVLSLSELDNNVSHVQNTVFEFLLQLMK